MRRRDPPFSTGFSDGSLDSTRQKEKSDTPQDIASGQRVASLRLAHRLDCWTTGVLCMCRTPESAKLMSILLGSRGRISAKEEHNGSEITAASTSSTSRSHIDARAMQHCGGLAKRSESSSSPPPGSAGGAEAASFPSPTRWCESPRLILSSQGVARPSAVDDAAQGVGFCQSSAGSKAKKNPTFKYLEQTLACQETSGIDRVEKESDRRATGSCPSGHQLNEVQPSACLDPRNMVSSSENLPRMRKRYTALFANPALLARKTERVIQERAAYARSHSNFSSDHSSSTQGNRAPGCRCSNTVHYFEPPLELHHFMPPGESDSQTGRRR